ncbi:MAG: FtsX-like permease family protein, partial [Geminicoccales bacterium]
PEMYYSYRQFKGRLPVPVVTLLVRTHGEPAALASTLRTIVRNADEGLVPEAIVPMQERLSTTLARPRLYAVLLGGFAAFALAIAAVGLFAVLSYTVAQRSRELAVRTALGARPVQIVGLVFRQGLTVAGTGVAIGLAGAIVLTRAMEALLYGVTAQDGFTYLLAATIVVAAAAAACVGPAWRAARLDPLRALRG